MKRQPILWPPGETVRLAVPRLPKVQEKSKQQSPPKQQSLKKNAKAPSPVANDTDIPTVNSVGSESNTNGDGLVLGRGKKSDDNLIELANDYYYFVFTPQRSVNESLQVVLKMKSISRRP